MTERIPAERRHSYYIGIVDSEQRVLERLSIIFQTWPAVLDELDRVRAKIPKAVIIEETLQRFIHGAG